MCYPDLRSTEADKKTVCDRKTRLNKRQITRVRIEFRFIVKAANYLN